MPLKHFTETFLVVVLGAVIALTGLLTSTLPDLPKGALPWTVLFVLSVVYPLSLHSLFQRRRADNFFRNLHWFPSFILLAWLLLQGIAMGSSVDVSSLSFFTWGFALLPVLVGFVCIVMFVLKVIRRRVPRLTFLAAILVPFTALAVFSEQSGAQYEQEVAAVLWQADFWSVDESGMLASWLGNSKTQSGKNLEASEDPAEEEWRERLRMQELREQRIAERMNSSDSTSSKSSSSTSSSSSKETVVMASVSSKPTQLPNSGMGWHVIISLFVIGYCAMLHDRSRRTA